MKWFPMFFITALFTLLMLPGRVTASTMLTAVYTQGSAINPTLHYTTPSTDVQLNLLNPIAETQFHRIIENTTFTQMGWNEFIDTFDEFGGLEPTIHASLEYAFDSLTETGPATNEFVDTFDESKLAPGIPVEHAFDIVTETDLPAETQRIITAHGMLHRTRLQQDSTRHVAAGFPSSLIGSNTIVITTDSDVDDNSRSRSPVTVQQQPEKLEAGYYYPYS